MDGWSEAKVSYGVLVPDVRSIGRGIKGSGAGEGEREEEAIGRSSVGGTGGGWRVERNRWKTSCIC